MNRAAELHAVAILMGPGQQDSETTLMIEAGVVPTLGNLSVKTCGKDRFKRQFSL